MRRRAFGANYWRHLTLGLPKCVVAYGLFFGWYPLAEWVLGKAPWFESGGVIICLAGVSFGIVVRLATELVPREIVVNKDHLVLDRSGFRRDLPLAKIKAVTVHPINAELSRVEVVVGNRKTRTIALAAPTDKADAILHLFDGRGSVPPVELCPQCQAELTPFRGLCQSCGFLARPNPILKLAWLVAKTVRETWACRVFLITFLGCSLAASALLALHALKIVSTSLLATLLLSEVAIILVGSMVSATIVIWKVARHSTLHCQSERQSDRCRDESSST